MAYDTLFLYDGYVNVNKPPMSFHFVVVQAQAHLFHFLL